MAWDDDNGNVKRTDEEALKIFNNILKDKSWIMEDIGRTKFKKGREEADIIYYIKISKIKAYFRVTKRWVKQMLGLETFNCPPKFKELIYFYTTVTSYYKKEKIKLNELNKYKEKLVFVNKKDINNILKSQFN